jgi:hypothetical protein
LAGKEAAPVPVIVMAELLAASAPVAAVAVPLPVIVVVELLAASAPVDAVADVAEAPTVAPAPVVPQVPEVPCILHEVTFPVATL